MIMLDIDVPNDCIECPMHDGESFYCNVNKINCNMDERPRSCPIIEDDWTPCSKELPEELIAVNVTWVNHNPELYYKEIKDKRFVDTAVYYQGDWYWWDCRCVDYLSEYGNRAPVEMVDSDVEIIAWKPLPEPYRGEKDGGEKDG